MGKATTVFILAIFWLIYGVICSLGISSRRCKYHGRPFEKDYKKAQESAYLMVGICWLAVSFLFSRVPMSEVVQTIILAASAIPGMVYSTKQERKYREMDEALIKEAAKIADAMGDAD